MRIIIKREPGDGVDLPSFSDLENLQNPDSGAFSKSVLVNFVYKKSVLKGKKNSHKMC